MNYKGLTFIVGIWTGLRGTDLTSTLISESIIFTINKLSLSESSIWENFCSLINLFTISGVVLL